MTGEEASLIPALKWLVDPDQPAPDLAPADAELLASLAAFHRVLPSLVARVEAAHPPWFPTPLLTRLRVQQHQARRRVRAQMAAAAEISQAMRCRGLDPPLFIKGFAAHALTTDPALLHLSVDMDCLVSDEDAFWDVLRGLGFAGRLREGHPWEWANFQRGDIALDVHRHFPIRAYPAQVHAARADELINVRDDIPFVGYVRYGDLAADALPGVAPGAQHLRFPGPELLCLVHAAHCFSSSLVRLHYMNPQRSMRLCELLSVDRLARHPQFEPSRFQALTADFSGQDAVQNANALGRAIFGRPLLPEPGGATKVTVGFPEHLIYGGWVRLQGAEEWLLPQDFAGILDRLGAATVPAAAPLNIREAPGLLVCGAGPVLRTRIDFSWDDQAESVAVTWTFGDTADQWAEQDLLIHLGHDTSARVGLAAGGEVREVALKSYSLPPHLTARADRAADGRAVRVVVPLPPGPAYKNVLPLFLGARCLPRGTAPSETVFYLPLRLRR